MVIVEVSYVPLGTGLSLSPYIAEVVKIIRASGLEHEFHSMGTNIEGEWDDVMALVKRCQNKLFEMGAPRVTTTLKISDRRDRTLRMSDKVGHVKAILNSEVFDRES
jgi:uncharacterized protein (TIGR00106 family)